MPAPAPAGDLGEEFEALYRAEFAFVWRMLLHFGTPESAVEDAAQEVFIVVHRRFADWDRRVSARSWLYGIARRVAASHRRSQARHARKLQALPAPDNPAPERELECREQLGELERALEQLEAKVRDVFVMAEVEGMSAREIAAATHANPNTVYSRLRKARAEVARALARDERRKMKRRHG